ncbi:MAG TPA: ROK family transcriptional regulator [Cellulomonas sp.]
MATSESIRSAIITLVAGGEATSRTELCHALRAPASTVSAAVQSLIAAGLLTESGTARSTGGRPRKRLAITASAEYVVAAEVGSSHARVGVVTATGGLTTARVIPFAVADGPEAGIDRLVAAFQDLIAEHGAAGLAGAGIALPGPVRPDEGVADSPSRMPGWHLYPVREVAERRLGVPVLVDNDANMMAFGEYTAHPETRTLITVKAGTAIGAGFVVDGNLFRGRQGAAGDLTHVRVASAGDRVCGCGNTGCLETVASGAALAGQLRAAGVDVASSQDIVDLIHHEHPLATQAAREAGRAVGEVLAAIVNFTTPDAVYLGGVFSSAEPYVAAVRGRLYESCHPLATRELVIGVATTGQDAAVLGVGRLALQQTRNRSISSLTNPSPRRTAHHGS